MYTSILVGTDGSATAAVAVDRAADIASAYGARLTLVCVGKPERAKKVLEAEAARVAPTGAKVETLAKDGDASTALVELAEGGGYDLLVVGNKGMTGASRFFLGSVPNKVSHHVPCSLLIVRTT